jgi:hypothetical protein
VLGDLIVMLADGGDCLSDLRLVGGRRALLGPVASIPTAWRVVERLARASEDAGAAPTGRLVLDLDATLVDAHTDRKQGAAGSHKHTFGSTRCWPTWTAAMGEASRWPGSSGRATPPPTTPPTTSPCWSWPWRNCPHAPTAGCWSAPTAPARPAPC